MEFPSHEGAKSASISNIIAATLHCGIDLGKSLVEKYPLVPAIFVSPRGICRGCTSAEFDNFRCDRLLPHAAQRCLKCLKFARDLAARSSHSFHPRFVFGGKSVERGPADLRVEIVLPQRRDEGVLGQLHQRGHWLAGWKIIQINRKKALS